VGFDRGLGEQQRWKGEKQEKEKGAVSHRPGMSLYLWAKALKKGWMRFYVPRLFLLHHGSVD
jgi:hypothetical protein